LKKKNPDSTAAAKQRAAFVLKEFFDVFWQFVKINGIFFSLSRKSSSFVATWGTNL